jgi:hypothetical protein
VYTADRNKWRLKAATDQPHHNTPPITTPSMPKPFAAIFLGTALSGVLGGPLAAGLLALDGRAGMQGWQWLVSWRWRWQCGVGSC